MTIIQDKKETIEKMQEFNNGFNSGYESGFEAGRESVIANRETFQKVKAEGVREGMERAKAIALHTHRDRKYTRTAYEAADEIQKEIDNE